MIQLTRKWAHFKVSVPLPMMCAQRILHFTNTHFDNVLQLIYDCMQLWLFITWQMNEKKKIVFASKRRSERGTENICDGCIHGVARTTTSFVKCRKIHQQPNSLVFKWRIQHVMMLCCLFPPFSLFTSTWTPYTCGYEIKAPCATASATLDIFTTNPLKLRRKDNAQLRSDLLSTNWSGILLLNIFFGYYRFLISIFMFLFCFASPVSVRGKVKFRVFFFRHIIKTPRKYVYLNLVSPNKLRVLAVWYLCENGMEAKGKKVITF